MKPAFYTLILFTLILLSTNSLCAQQGTVSSGGDLNGTDGSMSYTIGQVVYTSISDNSNSIAQGVQQPYEISIISSTGNISDAYLHLQITAFPNPTSEIVKLNIDGWQGEELDLQLFDIQGKIIQTKKISTATTELLLSDLPAGNYLLNLMDQYDLIQSFKISKQ